VAEMPHPGSRDGASPCNLHPWCGPARYGRLASNQAERRLGLVEVIGHLAVRAVPARFETTIGLPPAPKRPKRPKRGGGRGRHANDCGYDSILLHQSLMPSRIRCAPSQMEPNVNRAAVLSICALIVSASVPTHAQAGDGAFAAGLLGGLAAGAIIGATAPRYYYAPAPVYVAPAPVYAAPYCYWSRGELVWDGYRWVRSRIQVCN